MSLTRLALGFALASALVVSAAPALASAQTTGYYSNCPNYSYSNSYPYNYQNTPCQKGSLFVLVQVNAPANSYWSRSANDFTVSVSGGNAWPATVQGSTNAQVISVLGSYSVTAASFTGFTPSYSSGCTGSVSVGQTATCVVTETPVNMPYFNQYNYQYGYNSYNAPNVYVTPTYVPRLPNTGFEPQDGAAVAFAVVALIAMAFLTLPYVKKAFAAILG